MFRGFYHAGRMLRLRRQTERQGGLPGSRSAPVAWSTLLMVCGGAACFAGLFLLHVPALLLVGVPLLTLGLALALFEAIVELR